jgi:hypothetical protein
VKQREDPFDLQALRVDPNDGELLRLVKVPAKVQKRRRHFIKVPWVWFEKLGDAHGQTYRLALYLLYLYWKDGSNQPVKLPNVGLRDVGISRQSKWRVLADLERVGLISIERRPRRAPLIQLFHLNLP